MIRIRDARKLSHEALEALRRLGVSLVLAGEKQSKVASSLHVTRTTLVRWMMAYRSGGEAALAARKPPGRPPMLSKKQRERLRAIVVGKSPRQFGYALPRWNIRLIAQVIEREFGVTRHESTVSRMLRSMELDAHRPTRPPPDSLQCEHEQGGMERLAEIVGFPRSQQSPTPMRPACSD
ncbi:MAG TPA: helix-turn-helix domain-containing protein [Anaeromyxobacteraceae bacterium]|nr:helix-turn-helix domain-containing protein [Anaeromyxobacteraceae bacterium]